MPSTQIGVIGRKAGMTQIYNDAGDLVPVTVIEVTPNTITAVKTADGADGYSAVQIGAGELRASRLRKPLIGHAAKAGTTPKTRVREFRLPAAVLAQFSLGQQIGIELFAEGGQVDVTGVSKGKGFAGVMKRHNFVGFISTHGTHEYFRHGGSIGTRLTPGMTLKGKKMPGQMGNVRMTVQNLRVIRVDAEKKLLFLRGAVPGATGAIIYVRHSVKAAARAAHKASKK